MDGEGGVRQGRTRQRSKPLSRMEEASRDSQPAAWKQNAGRRLASKRRAQKTKGTESVLRRFKHEEACLRTRDLPSSFGGGELVVFRIRVRIRLGSGDGTRRLKLLGQPAPGGPWTKSWLDTNDPPDQDRHVADTMLG